MPGPLDEFLTKAVADCVEGPPPEFDVAGRIAHMFPNISVETLIDAIRVLIEWDLDNYRARHGDDITTHCLEGCINNLQQAALAYYASLK